MSRSPIKSIPCLVASLIAVSLSAGLIVHVISQRQCAATLAQAAGFAGEVLRRSDLAADQVAIGFRHLSANGGTTPCSDGNLALMREIDAASGPIRAIGWVENDRVVCSSRAGSEAGIPLGPVSWVDPDGAAIHTQVSLPGAPELRLAAVERDHYAALIDLDLPGYVGELAPGLSTATIAWPGGRAISAQGPWDPHWLDRLDGRREQRFLDHGWAVALIRSRQHAWVALAGLPLTGLAVLSDRAIAVPVSFASAAGLMLVGGLLVWRRSRGMPAAIDAALRRHEFDLEYEPIADLASGRWVGAEVLIRWTRPDGERVRPDRFIPVAEDTGQITEITGRVIELLMRDARDLFAEHPDFRLSINLSVADLLHADTLDRFHRLAAATAARPGHLIVEITERSMQRIEGVVPMIRALRSAGVKVALDDFGTGYSSLWSIANLELDYVKIDKSFIDAIGTETPTRHIVSHMIELARRLRLETIAEGVETERQAAHLMALGVRWIQGWMVSRSIPIATLRDGLARSLRGGG